MRRWLVIAALAAGCDERPAPPAVPFPSAGPSAAPAPTVFPTPAKPRGLNVILITVDALRADMPWVGYPRAIAPNLTRLAGQSVVYTHAYALSSYTSMSLGGLMSARYPSELPRSGLATSAFGDEALMLAEVLRAAGMKTLAVHGHVYFQGDTGMRQGFDDWRVLPKITTLPAREGHIVDDKLADMFIDGLGAHGNGRMFAWVHFMDPHFAYAKHEGQERFTGAVDRAVPPGVTLGKIGQDLKNLYDGEVRFTDAQIGRVLAFVEQQPWADRTAVIVTADHGEAFGEHKSTFEHGYTLWDVLTRVPLLIRVPGLPPARIDTRRSHVDLARTLCELAGVAAPEPFRGVSLLPELGGARPPQRDIVIDMPYTDQAPRRRALIRGPDKIVVTETEELPQVFDLGADPEEQNDLGKGERAAELRRAWAEVDRALPDFPAPRRGKRKY